MKETKTLGNVFPYFCFILNRKTKSRKMQKEKENNEWKTKDRKVTWVCEVKASEQNFERFQESCRISGKVNEELRIFCIEIRNVEVMFLGGLDGDGVVC